MFYYLYNIHKTTDLCIYIYISVKSLKLTCWHANKLKLKWYLPGSAMDRGSKRKKKLKDSKHFFYREAIFSSETSYRISVSCIFMSDLMRLTCKYGSKAPMTSTGTGQLSQKGSKRAANQMSPYLGTHLDSTWDT